MQWAVLASGGCRWPLTGFLDRRPALQRSSGGGCRAPAAAADFFNQQRFKIAPLLPPLNNLFGLKAAGAASAAKPTATVSSQLPPSRQPFMAGPPAGGGKAGYSSALVDYLRVRLIDINNTCGLADLHPGLIAPGRCYSNKQWHDISPFFSLSIFPMWAWPPAAGAASQWRVQNPSELSGFTSPAAMLRRLFA